MKTLKDFDPWKEDALRNFEEALESCDINAAHDVIQDLMHNDFTKEAEYAQDVLNVLENSLKEEEEPATITIPKRRLI